SEAGANLAVVAAPAGVQRSRLMSVSRELLRLIPSYKQMERETKRLRAEAAELRREAAALSNALATERSNSAAWTRFSPPGHFYSPLPSHEEIADAYSRGGFGPPFAAIDLNEAEQFARLERFAEWYPEQPFPEKPTEGCRFYLENPSYGHFDAIMLYGMLREARPRRVIEVGSGFSSAAMLDLNERLLGGAVQFTFIDPDMTRLRPLLRADDRTRVTLIEQRVQEVPLEAFAALEENDVLFIDSSHVSKIGSDVNRLFFDVLPALATGVLIHIHDVSGHLDYPRDWLEEGRAWNELYLLRAFLMHNQAYRIELFSAWLWNQKTDLIRERMPQCARGGGGQMWLRKMSR
ncbi:MAG TPA: class I SAM-dependent methyltransferase, partial [Candidatus Synoicihabitans sp.]|nr:class I SAM-dependent methyltransferase [Candidatus Synoicihabitans sp.]